MNDDLYRQVYQERFGAARCDNRGPSVDARCVLIHEHQGPHVYPQAPQR